MGFARHWTVLTVLRAFLGVFEAGMVDRSSRQSEARLTKIRRSLSWRDLYHWIVVPTLGNGSTYLNLLHGFPASFWVWSYLCIRPVSDPSRRRYVCTRLAMGKHTHNTGMKQY